MVPNVAWSWDNAGMTIATAERYAEMLDAARRGGYAYPAINVTSSQTLNAALQVLPMPSRMASSRFQWAAPRIFPVRA